MKKYFFYVCLLFSTVSFAQDKSFDIVIGTGFYSTPARKPIYGGIFFNGEFEYHYKNRWSFSAGAVMTRYGFEDPKSPSTIVSSGLPVSRGNEFQTNFLAKYKLISSKFITFQVGAGLGLINMGKEEHIITPTNSSSLFTSNAELGFPLSAELYAKITKQILIGVKFGSFIFPDYPIIGNNIGLQARFRL
jgi:hypothetical protein